MVQIITLFWIYLHISIITFHPIRLLQVWKAGRFMMASMSDNGIVLKEYQKKLKTMKKKYFVLYKDTITKKARLVYYDSEKKFMQNAIPKREIYVEDCFSINQRLDTKHKYVLALSLKDGGFGIVMNSEEDLKKWLTNLLSIQRNTNGTQKEYGKLLVYIRSINRFIIQENSLKYSII